MESGASILLIPTQAINDFWRRAVGSARYRLFWLPRKLRSAFKIRAGSRKILRRYRELRQGAAVHSHIELSLKERISISLSYKVTTHERLEILRAVLREFQQQMGDSHIVLRIIDASDAVYREETQRLIQSFPLETHYTAEPRLLTDAYLSLLNATSQPYFYLQFDDIVTVGLNPDFLKCCCDLLDRYEGLLPVVAFPCPHDVAVCHDTRTIRIVRFERRDNGDGDLYQFGFGPPTAPLFIENIGGHQFGIFENFQYGFFFNALIAPVADYRRRFEWYLKHISRTSVHQIELAAEHRTKGPFFTHIAICLSGVTVLDLDYCHTAAAVRPQIEANREVFDALEAGYSMVNLP